MTTGVVVIGVGNDWRRDDGVGLAVARAARARLGDQPGVAVVECDGEPSRLIDAWAGHDTAIVIDAVRSAAAPGAMHLWTDGDELPQQSPSGGSHALGVGDAVALGRALDRLPGRLVTIGIEAADTSTGQGLSPAVAAAVDQAVELVVELLVGRA